MPAGAELEFSGFDGELADLNGSYGKAGQENHGRQVFKKLETGQDVMVYFWDDRDGPQLQGWWVAPEVGGANVWAMNPDEAGTCMEPPQSGWKVPWHGDINQRVICARVQQQHKRVADNQWGANDSKRSQWGASSQWGQTDQYGRSQNQQWGTNKYQQWGHQQPQLSTHNQQQMAQGRLQEAERAAKQAAEEARRAEQEAKNLRMEEDKRKREGDLKRKNEERLRVGVQQASVSVSNAEKKFLAAKDNEHTKVLFQSAVKDITAESLRKHSDEEGKLIRAAMSSITGTKNSVQGKITEMNALPPSPFTSTLNSQLSGFLSRCDRALENTKALEAQKAERELLLWSQLGENILLASEKEVAQVEKAVEAVKDAAALLTSDLAEHLSPEETLKATDETDAAVKHASAALQAAHRNLQQKQKELASCPQKIQDKVSELMRKCSPWHQEINSLRQISSDASKKAKVQLEQKKKKEEELKKKRKIQRAADWNKQLVEDISAECIAAKLALDMGSSQEAEAALAALEHTFKDYASKQTMGRTKYAITSHEETVRDLRVALEKKKKVTFEGDVEMRVAAALHSYMQNNKRVSGDVFRMLSRGSGFVSQKAFETFAPVSLKVDVEMSVRAFKRIDVPRSTPRGKLTQEEFQSLSEFYLQVEFPVVMTQSEDGDEEIEELLAGSYLQLVECGMPATPGKCVRAKVRNFDSGKIGWITIFDDVAICKPCLFYHVIKETVLTESAEMKGLKVVRRVRKDEHLRLLAPPPSGSGIGRIKVQCLSDNKIGYITMCSNDVKYLEPHYFAAESEETEDLKKSVRVAFGEAIEVLTKEGHWEPASLVSADGDSITIAWEDETETVVPLLKIRTRGENPRGIVLTPPVPELEQKIIDRSEQLISKVEVPELKLDALDPLHVAAKEKEILATCASMQQHLSDVQKFLSQRDIQLRVHNEVLSMILSRVNTVQKNLNHRRSNLKVQIDTAIADAKQAGVERQMRVEEQRKADLLAERERTLRSAQELVDEVCGLFSDISTKLSMDLSGETSPSSFLEQLQKQYEVAQVKLQDGLQYLQDEMIKFASCDFSTGEVKLQFMKHQSRLRKLSDNLPDIDSMKEKYFSAERDALTDDVVAYLESKKMTMNQLFEELQANGVVNKDRFLAIFQTNLPFDESLDLEAFKMLVGNYWYALREVTLTSDLCVTQSKMVTNVQAFDIFRVIGQPQFDTSTKAQRVKVLFEKTEGQPLDGYISHQQGSIFYCKPLPKSYTLKLGTVVTDKPELTQLKVVKRLKVGEIVKPISLPRVSKLLLRVKGRCQDGTEGWFTLVDYAKLASFVKELDTSEF